MLGRSAPARRIVRDLGGEAFTIRKQHKTAYHAWGSFASPLLVATLVTAEQVARDAGLSAVDARKKMLPIVKQTIANYEMLGPAAAFSGPIVRGDAEIVRKHLQVLEKNSRSAPCVSGIGSGGSAISASAKSREVEKCSRRLESLSLFWSTTLRRLPRRRRVREAARSSAVKIPVHTATIFEFANRAAFISSGVSPMKVNLRRLPPACAALRLHLGEKCHYGSRDGR